VVLLLAHAVPTEVIGCAVDGRSWKRRSAHAIAAPHGTQRSRRVLARLARAWRRAEVVPARRRSEAKQSRLGSRSCRVLPSSRAEWYVVALACSTIEATILSRAEVIPRGVASSQGSSTATPPNSAIEADVALAALGTTQLNARR
jgi:hypothetical protein